ncbi:MAG: hypothetical protein EON54_28755, partial [Alcaligenaceae bacterium]
DEMVTGDHFHRTLLSDDPLARLDDVENFGRAQLVDRMVDVLQRVRVQSSSSVLAVIGQWGSGKTTVLHEMKRRLQSPEGAEGAFPHPWSVADFNPWLYSDAAALHAGFFEALRDALPKDRRWKQTRQNLAKFGRRISPLASIGQLAGLDGTQLANRLVDELEPSATRQRKTIEDALKAGGHPVLMILDDLDRLSAEELVHVFKLVRLVGRLPNVYYLLSYDEHTLVDLLGKTDLVATNDQRRALDYLEKMVQVRIDMPLLREHDVDRIVSDCLAFLSESHQLNVPVPELTSVVRVFDSLLSRRLRTPRALKRVFGQMDAFLSAVGREVNFEDFVCVT